MMGKVKEEKVIDICLVNEECGYKIRMKFRKLKVLQFADQQFVF